MRSAVGVVVTSAILYSVSVQLAVAQGQCAQILSHGIWETLDTSENVAISQEVANWACSARNSSSNGSVSYGDFKLGFGNGSGSNDCSNSSGKYALSSQAQLAIKKAAPSIVQAWKECILNVYGAHASVKHTPDPNQFGILLQVRDNALSRTSARVRSRQYYQCTEERSSLERGVVFRNSYATTCTRANPSEQINIDVNFGDGWGATTLNLPGQRKPMSADELKAKLVGNYQVVLGAEGGCRAGPPNSRPSTPARIEKVADGGFRSINECGDVSPLNVVSGEEVTMYRWSVRVVTVGESITLTEIRPNPNSWVKLP